MELANAFYIIGIICMSLITIILIAFIGIAIAIKVKVDHIHREIEAKFAPMKQFVKSAEAVAKKAKDKFSI